MLRCLFICLFAVGCSGDSVTQTTQAIQTKSEKKSYKPSELLVMETLPNHSITVYGRALLWKKEDGVLFVVVTDRDISVSKDYKTIMVVFKPTDDGEIRGDVERWFSGLYVDKYITISGKAYRVPESKDTYFDCESIN